MFFNNSINVHFTYCRFGKPNLLDIGGCDQAQILDLVKNKYDELKKGTYDSILDRSIFEEEK